MKILISNYSNDYFKTFRFLKPKLFIMNNLKFILIKKKILKWVRK